MELVSSSLERHIGYTSPSLNGAHLAEANGRWNPTYAKSLPFLGKDGAVPTPERTPTRKSARSSTRPASKLNKLSPPHSRPKALSQGNEQVKDNKFAQLVETNGKANQATTEESKVELTKDSIKQEETSAEGKLGETSSPVKDATSEMNNGINGVANGGDGQELQTLGVAPSASTTAASRETPISKAHAMAPASDAPQATAKDQAASGQQPPLSTSTSAEPASVAASSNATEAAPEVTMAEQTPWEKMLADATRGAQAGWAEAEKALGPEVSAKVSEAGAKVAEASAEASAKVAEVSAEASAKVAEASAKVAEASAKMAAEASVKLAEASSKLTNWWNTVTSKS